MAARSSAGYMNKNLPARRKNYTISAPHNSNQKNPIISPSTAPVSEFNLSTQAAPRIAFSPARSRDARARY
jgi:hypothetical protein